MKLTIILVALTLLIAAICYICCIASGISMKESEDDFRLFVEEYQKRKTKGD